MTTLPNKPSELIRLALSDLEKCENDPRYKISMSTTWHYPYKDGEGNDICDVCLAGSVMAQTLKTPIYFSIEPCNFEQGDTLIALDHFRLGWLESAMDALDLRLPTSIPKYIDVTSYSNDPEEFKRQMHDLADTLEREGL